MRLGSTVVTPSAQAEFHQIWDCARPASDTPQTCGFRHPALEPGGITALQDPIA